MDNVALKVGGAIFILVAVMHAMRVVMKVHVVIGQTYVPLRVSALLAVISFGLGVWLLKTACTCCKK